jgi:hypothetical protein
MSDITRAPGAKSITTAPDYTKGVMVTTTIDLDTGTTTVNETPLPAEAVAENTIRDDADKALDGLRQIATSTGTLTGAQLSNAVRLLARVAIRLVRLQLSKLDATD